MALVLNYTISTTTDCQNLTITDVTGDYNAITNPTGYGTPNAQRSDIISATISITDTNNIVHTGISLTLPTIQPTITGITAVSLGLGTTFLEGIYSFTITENTSGTSYVLSLSALNTCSTQACLDQKISLVQPNECDCHNKILMNLNKIDYYLQAGIYAATCNENNKALSLLNTAQYLCGKENCNC